MNAFATWIAYLSIPVRKLLVEAIEPIMESTNTTMHHTKDEGYGPVSACAHKTNGLRRDVLWNEGRDWMA